MEGACRPGRRPARLATGAGVQASGRSGGQPVTVVGHQGRTHRGHGGPVQTVQP
jgi:hypothetical protein